ncbi:MAG: hypothetical protein KIT30_00015 [Cyclobacteriaceae bacterium]|nr:hypothetical protein [Cyclobacteriaceae bacterium]
MILRRFILSLALLAYSASLAHSILPHSHYEAHQESNEHHEHSNEHHDDANGGLAFPVHDSNTDTELSKAPTNQGLKNLTPLHFVLINNVTSRSEIFMRQAFHVPLDLQNPDHPEISSRSLRAPPFIS